MWEPEIEPDDILDEEWPEHQVGPEYRMYMQFLQTYGDDRKEHPFIET
jgi:hypothetical protein